MRKAAFPPGSFEGRFSFWTWASSLPRLVLVSRTSFSHFLAKSFKVCRGTHFAPNTALFPLPVPSPGIFSASVPDPSPDIEPAYESRGLLLERVLHVVVMALNFIHADCKPIPDDVLRRHPSLAQKATFERLRVLLRACSRVAGSSSLCTGRRGEHLLARQAELRAFLDRAGLLSSPYPGSERSGVFVHHCTGGPASLNPYRDADPSRLLITGRGQWDASKYLGPELLLPFLEPATLRSIPANKLPFPDASRDDPVKNLEIFKIWDARNLLHLSVGVRPAREQCRIFGCYKSETADRMIGDRRGPNSLEGSVQGPSATLPPGPLLTQLSPVRYQQVLVGASTDRSDFYHQVAISSERARTNCVGPALALSSFAGTRAHANLLSALQSNASLGREQKGDGFGRSNGEKLSPSTLVYGCFQPLPRGSCRS